MKTSEKEKYLGDQITSKANSKDTIEARISRGHAVLAKMSALLSDIPLGKQRTETGMILRSAWFLNCCLFNSEVWTGYLPQDLHAVLYNLRGQSENEYRANLSHKYNNIRCPICDFEEDSQHHDLSCENINIIVMLQLEPTFLKIKLCKLYILDKF